VEAIAAIAVACAEAAGRCWAAACDDRIAESTMRMLEPFCSICFRFVQRLQVFSTWKQTQQEDAYVSAETNEKRRQI
jgi:hypothetical protein